MNDMKDIFFQCIKNNFSDIISEDIKDIKDIIRINIMMI